MLTFRLGKHPIHALAFSPDGSRLAVACGSKVTCLDWQSRGEPMWRVPLLHAQGCPIWLAFRPAGDGILAGYGNPRLHDCRFVLDFDLAGGPTVESSPVPVSPGVSLGLRSPVVVAGAAPTAYLATGYHTVRGSWHAFVIATGGHAAGFLAGLPATDPAQGSSPFDGPRAAWVVPHDRLLVWSEGLVRWFRWPPPPPPPPPSRWRSIASLLTGPRAPSPPQLELLTESPFLLTADAVAPLPGGDTFLVAHQGALVRWHAPTGTELARWRWPKMQALRSLAVSPDGTVAAAGGDSGRVVIWDLDV